MAQGRFADAVVDGFRALALRQAERGRLEDAPGATAHEVADSLAAAYPAKRGAIALGAAPSRRCCTAGARPRPGRPTRCSPSTTSSWGSGERPGFGPGFGLGPGDDRAAGRPERWFARHRASLLIGLGALLAVLLVVWIGGGARTTAPYDPANPGPQGARAVARVLADRGVEVAVARSAVELEQTPVGADTTVVVTRPSCSARARSPGCSPTPATPRWSWSAPAPGRRPRWESPRCPPASGSGTGPLPTARTPGSPAWCWRSTRHWPTAPRVASAPRRAPCWSPSRG